VEFLRQKLGDILVNAGLIGKEQLARALEVQAGKNIRLGKLLVEMGAVEEDAIALALSTQLKIPMLDPEAIGRDGKPLDLLPRNFMEERQVIPVGLERKILRLAMVDPLDFVTVKDVQFLTGKTVEPSITTPTMVDLYLKGTDASSTDVMQEALRKFQPDQIEVVEKEREEEEKVDLLTLRKAGEAAPVVGVVNTILTEAVRMEASDIHLEPKERELLVRYRVDGLLRDITTLAVSMHQPVVSRVKIMAKMDISVRLRPQDGSTKIRMGSREVDLRVSTLPTIYGEKTVIRLLDKSRELLSLKDLGMLPKDLSTLRALLSRPQGMVLVTGPTGSGKTTTLYAALLQVRSPNVNIVTVEDPVEYQIGGISQIQVNERAGISFSTGLKSILRQDPDIIMVGEIRDRITAEIAFQAALTGHLVLSTLHTNNAVAAITRLVNMGIESHLVASSVTGVVAQRLVRRTCPHCQVTYCPDGTTLADFGLDPHCTPPPTFVHGRGCDRCHYQGFLGRTGLYEVLRMDESIREMVMSRESEARLLAAARRGGMTTMAEDGLLKARKNATTLEEVERIVPPEEQLPGADGAPLGAEALQGPPQT
jgi:type II secretory ATPase GspE/PulE/Tfp pilus assembly ATPase PilB-like protein